MELCCLCRKSSELYAYTQYNNLYETEGIQQGNFISITEAPYFASFVGDAKISKCGAAILSEYWLVSAAHCLRINVSDFYYDATNSDVQTGATLKRGNGSVYSIDRVVLHENYSTSTYKLTKSPYPINDISLIKLEEPIKFNEYQQPIKIRSSPPKENDTVVVVGLGIERVLKDPPSLKKTVLSVAASGPPFFPNPFSVFHLQNSTSHLCPGDSGSPGVIDGELAGVVSIGDEMCEHWRASHENRYPGALTRIDLYYNWIVNHTGIEY